MSDDAQAQAAQVPTAPVSRALDEVDKQVAHREWTFAGDFIARDGSVHRWSKTYVQRPLSYNAMLQFTSLIGQGISEAMSTGMTIGGILGSGTISREDFTSVDAFVQGIAKLAAYVPDILEDAQCIWLHIPLSERPTVKDLWSRAPGEGGLTFKEGKQMLMLFLEQNWRELEEDFFGAPTEVRDLITQLRATTTASLEPSPDGDQPLLKLSKPIPELIESP